MFGHNVGGVFGFLITLFLLIAGVMAVFVPFWVFRIRNEVIESNKKLAKMIALLQTKSPE